MADAARLLLPLAGAAALAALVLGADAGLQRLDVGLGSDTIATRPHGAIMAGGFVGTLIAVERARASGRAVAALVPLLAGAGGVALLLGHTGAGQLLSAAAGVGLAALMVSFWLVQPQLPLLLGALGGLAWAGASATWWVTDDIVRAVPWWAAFLALTILAERLELTRFARRTTMPARLAAVLVVAALALSAWDREAGARALGAAFLLAGAWLLRADTARVSVRQGGRAAYIGLALLVAYAWLALAGALLLARGLVSDWYDATLHVYFVGFVLGAIFAHGPIIFPALTGRGLRVTPLLHVALAVLHVSVAIRLAAAVAEEFAWRQSAGLLHVAALALYAAGILLGVVLDRRLTARPGPRAGVQA